MRRLRVVRRGEPPQAGTVKDLATTTIGAVVQPGTIMVSLVPDDEPLLAEVAIDNKDIGFVAVDQSVRVKVLAYQFQKYGMLEGTVKTISADASSQNVASEETAAQPLSMFTALVQLHDQQLIVGDRHLPLTAGMQVSAEIVQGERTVLDYLLSPIQKIVGEAAAER